MDAAGETNRVVIPTATTCQVHADDRVCGWRAQNFHLKMVGKDGQSQTPKEYITNYLKEVDASNAGTRPRHPTRVPALRLGPEPENAYG